ncbi:aspartate aminotransferase [Marinitoga sp. 1135]|uniref:Aspartate/tyrosine/aromatic aminotransferase n=1 Tax=Marinitoga piezophila (strain DSM 14283 / JCM 11233 / KA3) TaxID=443254 RepID=H2J2Q1_MARPK|nr:MULTISPECIES: aspartate aminotransferase [Marinitoga]AEX84495.1 aspartate/tyrosine/aromatic aminotransferase [Marinitoga piezophila KA3]APT74991.1 aspartate aminotransferase [Marinitoga sp. 1137]NUU94747.1 aspartate aminotransferase [Marinitoga sp. 1135]NUU96676.1 aspartate aminotransferase [Marinitoga sp. 1138]
MISKIIKSIQPSITLELNAKAIELEKSGEDVVKLTAGEPDFITPKEIIESAYKAMLEGKTKYTDSAGILELREKIADFINSRRNTTYTPDNIVVSNGGKQALYNTLLALLNPADEVIMLDPAWVSYEAQIKMARGIPVHVPLKFKNNFIPKASDIEPYLSERTKAIIINSPNNPTGAVYPEETFKEIYELIKDREIYIISDEVYEKLVFEGDFFSPTQLEELRERTIIINAFSKTWSMTGWRVGYSVAPKEISKEIKKIQSHLSSNINTPAQYGALSAFDVDIDYYIEKFDERRKFVLNKFNQTDLPYVYPKGAFYLFIDVSKYDTNDLNFCNQLLKTKKLAVIPGSGFGAKGFIRISYANSIENLEKGINRLIEYINEVR